MSDKPWNGRFAEKTDRSVEAFTSSIAFDKRLYAYDIEGSVAHCKMMAHTGILTEDEAGTLIEGLGKIRREIEHDDFSYDDSLEDIHMHIEARLLQEVGKVAQKLHTARSRNDQVALDVRLYLRDQTTRTIERLHQLRRTIVTLAKDHTATILPGYTHMQRAQPILLAHHLMAYYEMFTRDAERFADCLTRINVLPLGCAALAGTTYPIDRAFTARLLNFPKVAANSVDAVADRDFIIEFLACASICMVHFSRLSEEMVLWSSSEFKFIELPDAFATGSSIMPQKKNPDVPELVRGKTGRVFGDLVSVLTLMKSLPLSYNRDMQEDKEPLFNAVDIVSACIDIYTKMLPRLKFNHEVMRAAASVGFLNATDLADYLVAKGVPFRKAHSIVGQAVGKALELGKELHEMSLEALQAFDKHFDQNVFDVLSLEQMIDRRRATGGTATAAVREAIAAAEAQLDQNG
jgi:argininosuccinate lyase